MNPDALAEVYVSKGTAKKNVYLGFATGYPIARDRVITAGHVFTPGWKRVEVRFRDGGELIPATLVRDFRPGFDVAVLKCKIPPTIDGQAPPLEAHPTEMVDGQGFGFPRATEADNTPGQPRKREDLRGTLKLLARDEWLFDFEATFDYKVHGEGWRGLSGSPVFLASRIAGIIQEYRVSVTPACFRVVAMCRLLQQPEFRQAIGWTDGPGDDARQQSRERIEAGLRRLKPEVLLHLAGKNARATQNQEERVAVVLKVLLENRLHSNLAKLVDQYEKLCSALDWNQADFLADVFDEVAPLVIHSSHSDPLWNEIHQRSSVLCRVPEDEHGDSTIELLMARVDGRNMSHKPLVNSKGEFEGSPKLPRFGMLVVGSPASEDEVARAIVIDLLKGHDLDAVKGQSSDLNPLVDTLAGVLTLYGGRFENQERTLYCFHMLRSDRDKDLHERALNKVRARLDQLKRDNPAEFGDLPRLVFLWLAKESAFGSLRPIIVRMLRARSEYRTKRTTHGPNV